MTDPKAIPAVLYRKAIEGEFRNRGLAVPPAAILDQMATATRQAVIANAHGLPVTASGTVMGAANLAVNHYVAGSAGASPVEAMAAGKGKAKTAAMPTLPAPKRTAKRSPSRPMALPSATTPFSQFGEGVVQLFPLVAAEYLAQRKKAPSEIKALGVAIALRAELVKQVRASR